MPTDLTLPAGAIHYVADFNGTPEQAAANRKTHRVFAYDPHEPGRCDGCDCRESSRIMDYPCGDPIDRIARYADGTEIRYTEQP